jgi:uncharacterized OB-fold protein
MSAPPPRHGIQARRFRELTADGILRMPVCRQCGTVAYPFREACGNCLQDALEWREIAPAGTLLATTTLHHSNEPYFRAQLPIRIGSVQLGGGAVVLAFLADAQLRPDSPVLLAVERDAGDEAVIIARPATQGRGPA